MVGHRVAFVKTGLLTGDLHIDHIARDPFLQKDDLALMPGNGLAFSTYGGDLQSF